MFFAIMLLKVQSLNLPHLAMPGRRDLSGGYFWCGL